MRGESASAGGAFRVKVSGVWRERGRAGGVHALNYNDLHASDVQRAPPPPPPSPRPYVYHSYVVGDV